MLKRIITYVVSFIVMFFVGWLGYISAAVAERGNDPMVCAFGYAEDDCRPDFIGDGEWTLRPGHK